MPGTLWVRVRMLTASNGVERSRHVAVNPLWLAKFVFSIKRTAFCEDSFFQPLQEILNKEDIYVSIFNIHMA